MSSVDRLYEDYLEAIKVLEVEGAWSLVSAINENMRKSLLLAAASHFEHLLTGNVEEFVRNLTDENGMILSLVKKKAIVRQYHTWFAWERANVNVFLSLFGDEFKNYVSSKIAADDELDQAVKDFVSLGAERNRLVHGNFVAFPLEKTPKEIFDQYRSAIRFVNMVPTWLNECAARVA